MKFALDYKKTFFVLICFLNSLSLAAPPDVETGCTFLQSAKKPGIQGILTDAETILKNLQQGKDQCRFQKNEYDTLKNSIDAFKNNEQLPTDYQLLYSGGTVFDDTQISCYNYSAAIHSAFQAFINNLSNNTQPTLSAKSKLMFAECYTNADPPGCAAVLSQTFMNDYAVACKSKKETFHDRNKEAVALNGIASVQKIVTQSLEKMSDPSCRDDLSGVYTETLRATLNIGAQVASLGTVPTLAGVGMMSVVGILDSMIGFLNDKQDFLKKISNETNFNTTACFYKAVQSKTFNCAGYELEKKITTLNTSRQSMVSKCDINDTNFVVQKELSDLIGKAVAPPASVVGADQPVKSASDQTVLLDQIIEALDGKTPQQKEFWADFENKLNGLSGIDKNNPDVIRAFKLDEGSRNQKRRASDQFDQFKKRIESMNQILKAQKNSKNKFDNQDLETALQNFSKENEGEFILYVDQILNVSDQVQKKSSSSFLATYNAQQQIKSDYYKSLDQLHESTPGREVSLVFEALNNNFADSVINRIQKISEEMAGLKKISKTSSMVERANQFSQTVKPLLDSCALLEPTQLMTDINTIKTPDSDFKSSCQMFSCADGTGLQLAGRWKGPLEQYKRNVCAQDLNYNNLLKKFQNEYESQGTVCGQ